MSRIGKLPIKIPKGVQVLFKKENFQNVQKKMASRPKLPLCPMPYAMCPVLFYVLNLFPDLFQL